MPKVMVVDDNSALARSIARALAEHDVTVEVNSTTAIERVIDSEIDGRPYDVIVCDANMPGKNGRDVLAATRSLAQPPLFVMISGYPQQNELGADAVLLKPFAGSELRALVACMLGARESAKTRRLPRCG